MATDAFHHHAHGSSGARLLACLDPLDGADVRAPAQATGLHRTTVKPRPDKPAEDSRTDACDDVL
jgi:hypothetical protein